MISCVSTFFAVRQTERDLRGLVNRRARRGPDGPDRPFGRPRLPLHPDRRRVRRSPMAVTELAVLSGSRTRSPAPEVR